MNQLELQKKALDIRKGIIEAVHSAKAGHPDMKHIPGVTDKFRKDRSGKQQCLPDSTSWIISV